MDCTAGGNLSHGPHPTEKAISTEGQSPLAPDQTMIHQKSLDKKVIAVLIEEDLTPLSARGEISGIGVV